MDFGFGIIKKIKNQSDNAKFKKKNLTAKTNSTTEGTEDTEKKDFLLESTAHVIDTKLH